MRGSIKRRSPNSYAVILRVDVVDPATGAVRRKPKWFTVRGTRRDAEAKLAELLKDAHENALVLPTKRLVREWLDEWMDKAIKPPVKTARTYETYTGVIRNHIQPAIGGLRLQGLKAIDLEHLYAAKRAAGLAPASVQKIHTVMFSALKAAVRAGLVKLNVADRVIGKPVVIQTPDGIADHCWTAEEASRFLAVARDAGARQAAFYTLALTTGLRKGELCGLRWTDVDVVAGRLSVRRQLLRTKDGIEFTALKGKQARTVDLSGDVVELLRLHRAAQNLTRMRNRTVYHDMGLVFAKDWTDKRRHDVLGHPLQANNIGEREFARLVREAGVRRIKFHGLRHTCATLMLAANVPAKVVQERLGHKKITTTLDVYAHVLPSMQREAADALAAALRAAASRTR